MTDKLHDIAQSYDQVARAYAEQLFDELRHKPLDRTLLDAFAEQVDRAAPVLEVGCGPGQISRALAERGVSMIGSDLSPEMIEEARRRSPHIPFRVRSMLALEEADASYSGVVAFYAIVHFSMDELALACRELFRVLLPAGLALISFHLGREVLHRDELFGQRVNLDFVLFERGAVENALTAAGFQIEAVLERAPYADFEHPTRRCYLLARRPAA